MNGRRWYSWLLVAALLGTYGYRAVEGVQAGWAFYRGRVMRNMGDYPRSLVYLGSAGVGANRVPALLMAGEVRLDLWEAQVRRRGALGADPNLLVGAGNDFLSCRCIAPTARRSWKGLGEVYDAIEWIGREHRAETPYVRPESPWSRVGRPGRIAVGLLRLASEVTPNWSRLHDRLALTLWDYGLDDLARDAVRDSARVLPFFYRHPYHDIPELPEWTAEEFAAASREVLGQIPLVSRSGHLLDLGKLERRIGADDRAIEALREVLALGGDELRRAEASFHLGLALIGADGQEEGRSLLDAASEHPVFRVSALRSLANLAEKREEYDLALAHLRSLRREQPSALDPCLQFARVAQEMGEWPAALESLRWARLNHPDDARPYVALVEVHLAMGDTTTAASAVVELEHVPGVAASTIAGLRRQIAELSGTKRGSSR